MNRNLLVIIAVLLLPVLAQAATIEASWNPVTLDIDGQPESVSHYVLYWGQTSRPGDVVHPSDSTFTYDNQRNVGNVTQVQQADLIAGQTYYFAVAAVDVSGNLSAYSTEVSVTLPADDDGGPEDGGIEDGGVDAGPDAGDSGQAGDEASGDQGGGSVEGGCGCSGHNAQDAGLLLLLLAPALLVRRQSENRQKTHLQSIGYGIGTSCHGNTV